MFGSYPVLDLHGEKHESADYLIEKFITDNFNNLPVLVITGYSDFFIGKTKEIADKHDLFCYKQYHQNHGCYVVMRSPWFSKEK
jgi:hypothetical protein